MQVQRDRSLQEREAPEFDLFANDAGHLPDRLSDRAPIGQHRRRQSRDVTNLQVGCCPHDRAGQRLEVRVLGHEVRLAQHFEQNVVLSDDESIARRALGTTLGRLGCP